MEMEVEVAVAVAAMAACTQPLSRLSGDDWCLNQYAQPRGNFSISPHLRGLLSDSFFSAFFMKKANVKNHGGGDEKHTTRLWVSA